MEVHHVVDFLRHLDEFHEDDNSFDHDDHLNLILQLRMNDKLWLSKISNRLEVDLGQQVTLSRKKKISGGDSKTCITRSTQVFPKLACG